VTGSTLAANLLSLVTFLPLAGAVVLMCLPAGNTRAIRATSLVVALLTFAASLMLIPGGTPLPGFTAEINLPWITQLGARFHLALDGISLWLVLLNTLLFVVSILVSMGSITQREKLYYILMLVLETAITGFFLAQDLLLFYIFFEATLIPMYFLIGMWGGKRRLYATTKFVLYTMAGSLLMLGAIIAIYLQVNAGFGSAGFDIADMAASPRSPEMQLWCFLAFFLAFAIKVPLFPLHTWLPDAHTEAPTAGSIILAGVLLKMGVYGFIRVALPLCPDAPYAAFGPEGIVTLRDIIMALSVIGIIYGALVAAVQIDVKRLVAYSSVAHMGFVMLGLFSFNQYAVDGAIIQMVNHGISTGALFMLVGFIYDRRHTRLIADFGGLARPMPVYYNLFLLVMLSSVGLPALNGFVGEFMILIGTFKVNWLMATLATTGVILAAVYLLYMFRRMFFGEVTHEENRALPDLNRRELVAILPLAALTIILGVLPMPFLSRMTASSTPFVEAMQASGDSAAVAAAASDSALAAVGAGRLGGLR
jgi:NADH-quinone oxidoreductase subunit M